MVSYTLVDVQERHRAYPDTFEVPSAAELAALELGDKVQLVFNDEERMWVVVTDVRPRDYRGRLLSFPLSDALENGDYVVFERRHVLNIWDRGD